MPRQTRKLSESGNMHTIVRALKANYVWGGGGLSAVSILAGAVLRGNRGQNLCLLPDGKPRSPVGLRPGGPHVVDNEKAGRELFPIFQSEI